MNTIQNYGSINVNSNYGKVNKSPNFKAFIKTNGAGKRLENWEHSAVNYLTKAPKDACISPLMWFDMMSDGMIKELKDAIKLKKVATGTKYFDGVYDGKAGERGIKFAGEDTVFTAPFNFMPDKQMPTTLEGKVMGKDERQIIMTLSEDEAKNLKDFSAAGVLEALENIVKNRIREIKQTAMDLM